jgi:glycine dehydrogenase subunit 1
MSRKKVVHPYIPNSVPATKEAMLKATGASSIEEFYADIPDPIRLKRGLNLPEPFTGTSKDCCPRTSPPMKI